MKQLDFDEDGMLWAITHHPGDIHGRMTVSVEVSDCFIALKQGGKQLYLRIENVAELIALLNNALNWRQQKGLDDE